MHIPKRKVKWRSGPILKCLYYMALSLSHAGPSPTDISESISMQSQRGNKRQVKKHTYALLPQRTVILRFNELAHSWTQEQHSPSKVTGLQFVMNI